MVGWQLVVKVPRVDAPWLWAGFEAAKRSSID